MRTFPVTHLNSGPLPPVLIFLLGRSIFLPLELPVEVVFHRHTLAPPHMRSPLSDAGVGFTASLYKRTHGLKLAEFPAKQTNYPPLLSFTPSVAPFL